MRSRKDSGAPRHPTDSELQSFADGALPSRSVRRILAHFRHCQICAGKVLPLLTFDPKKVREDETVECSAELDEPIERAISAVLRRHRSAMKEREKAAPVVQALLAGTRALSDLSEEQHKRLRGLPLIDLLLEWSMAARYSEPAQMIRWAELALVAIAALDANQYGWREVNTLWASAQGELANALRVADNLAGAERSLEQAAMWASRGSDDPQIAMRLADIGASLLSDQRRFPEAMKLLDEVAQSYLAVGERHLAGRTFISLGLVKGYNNEPDQAVRILVKARLLLEEGADPSLDLAVVHALSLNLVELGFYQKARRVVWENRWRYFEAGDRLNLLRLAWLEGKIHFGLGELAKAESALRRARRGFQRDHQHYDAALCGLDLALVWVQQGRRPEVKALARQMIAAFRRFGIAREAIAALLILREQCVEEWVTNEEIIGRVKAVAVLIRELEHGNGREQKARR